MVYFGVSLLSVCNEYFVGGGGKKEKKWIWLLLIAFVISIISKWELINVNSEYEIVNTTYKIIVNDFRPHNFIFFVLGMYLGEVYRKENVSFGKNMRIIVGLAVVFGFITTIVLFFNHNNFLDKMNFFVMNCALIIILVDWAMHAKIPRIRVVEFMGQYSMPIYLYHVECKIIAEYFFKTGSFSYYLAGMGMFVVGCFLIYLLRNVPLINRFLFGSTTTSFPVDRKI